ncbi:hypothetical protein [Comamonas jiangduensis]|uniref:hypothetical protein n=1 Tax=Comamonas jiangduensis TaxID=1194168 RepID=UPI00158344D3|nr:hypothetical protein [Comamonas jiangduensis]
MTTVIQNLPTPPTPADTPTEFNSKAFSLLGALPGFATQANQLGGEMTNLGLEAGQDAEAARLHKEAAAGSAGAAAGSAAAASTSAGQAAGAASAADTAKMAAESARDAAAGYAASIDPAYLRDRANHTGTQPISTVTDLQTALDAKADNSAVAQAIAMAATFTTVPATFQAWIIVVTQPHLRQMVWSVAKNRYVRAPWHPVGKAGYFLREVGEGFLQVRGDVVLQAADFPDLAEYLGVTGSTFVLDEARGEFIRNADSGRGKDAGRVIGSHQGDAGRNLTGTFGYVPNPGANNVAGAFAADVEASQQVLGTISGVTRVYSLNASRQWPVAGEFRPTNRAYIFAVTY